MFTVTLWDVAFVMSINIPIQYGIYLIYRVGKEKVSSKNIEIKKIK